MKQTFKFLTLFLLTLLGTSNLWATDYTVYFSPQLCGKSWSNPYVGCDPGWGGWHDNAMTSTGKTFHGFPVYSATIHTHDSEVNVNNVQFYEKDNFDDKIYGISSWGSPSSLAACNGKICTGKDTWVDYVADSEQTFYFCPKVAGKDWTTPYANCNLGYNNWSNVQMTEVSGKTFCGQKVYQATVTTCAFDKIEFHSSSSDYSGKIELTNPSGVNGKLYNGSEWKTFNYDTEYTFYFATDWSAVYANCNLGYSIWKDLAMTNTGKTYNGKKIYSITVAAQGFNDIEFHKSNGGDWDSKVVGYSNSTTYKKDFTNALCTSVNTWVTYEYDVTVTPQTCVNGTISPSGAQTFLGSTGKQFTANGSAGYCWASWVPSGGVNATNANPTIVTATQNGTLSATFKQRYILRGSENVLGDTPGGMPGWHETTNANYTINGNVATITANLTAANQQYKFRIYDATTENTMRGQTGSSEMKSGDNWQLNGSNDVLFTSTIPGTYTFAINFSDATSPSLTLTFPSFSRTITVPTQIQPQAAFDITLGSPTVSGFTPTKYMLCAQKDEGEWTESGQINANTYSYTPSGAGNYKFKVRAYANETDYLESAESNTVKVAGLEVIADDYNPSKGALVKLTPTPSSNLTTDDYNLSYAFTQKPDGSTAELSPNDGKIEFTGDIPGTYKVQVILKDKQDTRTLATSIVTINYVDEYWIYFKKTVDGWGDKVFLYFEVTWNDMHGVQAGVAPIEMDQIGESDVYGIRVPQQYENMGDIAFCNTSVNAGSTLTGIVANRGDYNKTFNMFVPSTQTSGKKAADYYSNGRWFKYDTDKGYKLIVGGNETALTFPSEASLTPANINLELAANQELTFTLESQGQSTTFYLPSTLEISNCADLLMTDVSNSNKFLTALAGQYQVSIDFDVNNPYVEPTINVTYPAVPAPSVTFTEQRYNGDNALSFISGDGSQASPYQFFMDEKMTLTISEMPEVKGLTAYYKFGESDASATRTLDIVPEDNEVHSITMEAYYEKGTIKTASTTKTIYYQALAVPAIHLTSSLTNDEVNYDDWGAATRQIRYSADNYSGAFSITKNSTAWHSESGATHDYTIENPGQPAFINFHASFIYGSREFTQDLTITAYRNVVYKVKDGSGFTGTKVYMWRDGTDPTVKSAAWPGEDFLSNFGTWHIFTVKYPVYDRCIVNDGQGTGHQTQDITVDGTSSSVCLQIANAGETGTGDNSGKIIYEVSSAECPGNILVDAVENQSVTKNTSKLIAPNVYLMVGVTEQDITMEIETNNDNVTALQSGMSVLVTGMKTGTTNVTVKYYYHKDQLDQELAQILFTVTITQPQITIRANIATDLGWNQSGNHDNLWFRYWKQDEPTSNTPTYTQMTFDKYNTTTTRDEYTITFTLPDGTDEIKFQVGYPNVKSWDDEWRKSWVIEHVSSSSCYNVSFNGDNHSRKMEAIDCGDSEYQIVINMNSGDEYKSNKVTSTDATLSFFAPGASETGYKAGLVRLFNKDIQLAIIPASTFAASGVYTATINDTYNGLDNVELYTGDYYIRTDGADGHWDNYKTTADNKFTPFIPIETSTYDHYWVKNIKPAKEGDKVNLQACVANDYNENLANKIVESNYTDENGSVTPDGSGVNVRFGYSPSTNNFERAIIKGSSTNEFLNVIGDNVYKEKACSTALNTQNADSKFEDKEQWIYEKTVYVKIEAGHTFSTAKLQSADYNGNVMYQLGYEINPVTGKETSTPKTFGLIAAGTTNGIYAIKLIYDFKTNRMVSGWSPDGDISGKIVLDADILLVRKHQESAAQIRFANTTSSIQDIHHIYGVLTIEKNQMLNATNDDYAKTMYWISFPFDVKISEIFGVDGYGQKWIMQKYRGDLRAQKGWFKGDGTETFWEFMDESETLKAYEGYLFLIDANYFNTDGADVWKNSATEANFYFPSASGNIGIIAEDKYEQTVPDHECKINRWFGEPDKDHPEGTLNHTITDSHWNVIGVPAFQNKTMALGTETETNMKAIYEWDSSDNTYDVKALSTNFEFKTMYAYMVQYTGTINWLNVSVVSKPTTAPYRYIDEKNYMIELFFNGNGAEDHTYINLADEALTDFVLNEDMMKIDNAGFPNIYSFAGNYNVAYNETKRDNQTVMLGVSAPKDGTYTFSMPKEFSGTAKLVDLVEGITTDLNVANYSVDLNKGTYNNRFQLVLEVEAKTPTSMENVDGASEGLLWNVDGKTTKLLRNGNIYLINGGRVYNVLGVEE